MEGSPALPYARLGGARWVAIAGGVLLVVALFLPWYGTGGPPGLPGTALASRAPELGALPALGILTVLGSALLWRGSADVRARRMLAGVGTAVGVLAVALPVESGARLSGELAGWFGPAYWDAAGAGWYIALAGGFLVLGVGVLKLVEPMRRTG